MSLILRLPKIEDEAQVLRAIEIIRQSEPHFGFAHYYEEVMLFGKWVQIIEEKSRGIGILSGHVQSTFLVSLVDGDIVGRLSFRHTLNEGLLRVGGHIGYAVLPQYRRKGYAIEMLRQSLPLAKQVGLAKVLLTCDQGNIGSQKNIEACGGVLENIISVEEGKPSKMPSGSRFRTYENQKVRENFSSQALTNFNLNKTSSGSALA